MASKKEMVTFHCECVFGGCQESARLTPAEIDKLLGNGDEQVIFDGCPSQRQTRMTPINRHPENGFSVYPKDPRRPWQFANPNPDEK